MPREFKYPLSNRPSCRKSSFSRCTARLSGAISPWRTTSQSLSSCCGNQPFQFNESSLWSLSFLYVREAIPSKSCGGSRRSIMMSPVPMEAVKVSARTLLPISISRIWHVMLACILRVAWGFRLLEPISSCRKFLSLSQELLSCPCQADLAYHLLETAPWKAAKVSLSVFELPFLVDTASCASTARLWTPVSTQSTHHHLEPLEMLGKLALFLTNCPSC